MGELNVERFLVPEGPNFFRLELRVAGAASIQAGPSNEHSPYQAPGISAACQPD